MLDADTAAARIHERLVKNGGDPEKVQAVPKGEGVWLAYVKEYGTDEERQGVFLDADLSD